MSGVYFVNVYGLNPDQKVPTNHGFIIEAKQVLLSLGHSTKGLEYVTPSTYWSWGEEYYLDGTPVERLSLVMTLTLLMMLISGMRIYLLVLIAVIPIMTGVMATANIVVRTLAMTHLMITIVMKIYRILRTSVTVSVMSIIHLFIIAVADLILLRLITVVVKTALNADVGI
jgi:E3 ubiquitin-protein ligase DOA10